MEDRGTWHAAVHGVTKSQTPLSNWTTTEKLTRDSSRHFPRENLQVANDYMKGCSTSLVIMEMQIKTSVRYHCTPVRIKWKRLATPSVGEEEKLEFSYTADGNVKWYTHFGKHFGSLLKSHTCETSSLYSQSLGRPKPLEQLPPRLQETPCGPARLTTVPHVLDSRPRCHHQRPCWAGLTAYLPLGRGSSPLGAE